MQIRANVPRNYGATRMGGAAMRTQEVAHFDRIYREKVPEVDGHTARCSDGGVRCSEHFGVTEATCLFTIY